MTDGQLLRELRNGSESAFEAMVYRYHGAIYAYLYRMLGGEKPLAEDLTQECFLRAIQAIRNGMLPDLLRPWLYKIAGNLCRDYWRKGQAGKEVPLLETDQPVSWSEESVASIFDRQQERERVVAAVQQLNPEKRNLIVLRFYQELKLEEIGRILEIPLSTVKSRLYQSLGELNRLLQEPIMGPGRNREVKG